MGFYVNLEMSKDCQMCPFAHYDMFHIFTGCDITRGKRWAVKNDKDYAESSTRPDWCPLIEVPEPHGRLIDADALIAAHEQVCSRSMKFNLDLAQTIIPASEEAE